MIRNTYIVLTLLTLSYYLLTKCKGSVLTCTCVIAMDILCVAHVYGTSFRGVILWLDAVMYTAVDGR